MDSHTSAMLAIFFARMSPLIPETGEVIWWEIKKNAGDGRDPRTLLPTLHRGLSPGNFPVWKRGDGLWVHSWL